MRGQIIRFREGFTVIDDSYNSNPRALTQMVETLAAARSYRRRVLVAGEMLELGQDSEALHYQCGVEAAHFGIDVVVGIRGAAREIVRGAREAGVPEAQVHFFTEINPATDFVSRLMQPGDLALVKGSRGVHLEEMVRVLRSHYTELID
jgi:UDP-N-acetylmuramoyl-tripeptide--D-alanyl-D-alanine ligase